MRVCRLWGVRVLVVACACLAATMAVVPPSGASFRGVGEAGGRTMSLAKAPAGLREAVLRALGASASSAVQTSPPTKLSPVDDRAGDTYGWSLTLDGSTAVVGAPGGAPSTASPGAAYVFVRSGSAWSEQAMLTAPPGASGKGFGWSVAISGSTIVVGAPYTGKSGEAYVFERSGGSWSRQGELTASDPEAGDDFGWSVGVSGSRAVVGAPHKNSRIGAAYVFERSGATWSQRAKLTASDEHTSVEFGSSVAISGSTVLVGARYANHFDGRAYVFERSGSSWSQQAKLTPSDGSVGEFGSSVAISGSYAVVGAPHQGTGARRPGAAYVFARSGLSWSQEDKLTPSDAARDFGSSVAISGTSAIVGAPSVYGLGPVPAAYMFERSGGSWSQAAKLTAPPDVSNEGFGWAVAISPSLAVVGAQRANLHGGAAYGSERSGGSWSQAAKLAPSFTPLDGSAGTSVAISRSTAVVGVPGRHSGSGAAFVFERSGSSWSQQAMLTASDPAPGVSFGWSVAISGSFVVVGAPHDASRQGAAYVFVHRERCQGGRCELVWEQEGGRLTLPDAAAGDDFGSSVAVSSSTAVVGAPGRYSADGAAYVFQRFRECSTCSSFVWLRRNQLTASDHAKDNRFGSSVAVSGTDVLAGAPYTHGHGAAYVFVENPNGWEQKAKLTAAAAAARDHFGYSVAFNGSTALVGAPGKDSNAGAAYVFERSGSSWSQQDKLTAHDATAGASFGSSVAISGSTAVVGAYQKNADTGAVYVFKRSRSTWLHRAKKTARSAAGDEFGRSVALDGSTAIVGAPGERSFTGAAYVFADV